jgi:hypothetical protein
MRPPSSFETLPRLKAGVAPQDEGLHYPFGFHSRARPFESSWPGLTRPSISSQKSFLRRNDGPAGQARG